MRVTSFLSAASLAVLYHGASALPTTNLNLVARAESGPEDAAATTASNTPTAAATATADVAAPAATTIVADDGLPGTPHGYDTERILKALQPLMYDPNEIWKMLGPAVQLGPNSKAGRLRNGNGNVPQPGAPGVPGPLRRRDIEAGLDGLPVAGQDGETGTPTSDDKNNKNKTSATSSADDAKATTDNGTKAQADGEYGNENGEKKAVGLEQVANDEAIVEDVSVSVAVSDSCANCYNMLQIIVV